MTAKSPGPPALTWTGVTARRMARHALTEPATGLGPAEVAGLLCGAHAQVLSAAELSIGRRIAGAVRTDVRRALREECSLVKTFGPRGTIHLVAALAPAHCRRRAPRHAVLRAGPGPQRDLHQPAPLAT